MKTSLDSITVPQELSLLGVLETVFPEGSGETMSESLHGDREGAREGGRPPHQSSTRTWAFGDTPESCLPGTLNMLEGHSVEGQALGVLTGTVFKGTEKGIREGKMQEDAPSIFRR